MRSNGLNYRTALRVVCASRVPSRVPFGWVLVSINYFRNDNKTGTIQSHTELRGRERERAGHLVRPARPCHTIPCLLVHSDWIAQVGRRKIPPVPYHQLEEHDSKHHSTRATDELKPEFNPPGDEVEECPPEFRQTRLSVRWYQHRSIFLYGNAKGLTKEPRPLLGVHLHDKQVGAESKE